MLDHEGRQVPHVDELHAKVRRLRHEQLTAHRGPPDPIREPIDRIVGADDEARTHDEGPSKAACTSSSHATFNGP